MDQVTFAIYERAVKALTKGAAPEYPEYLNYSPEEREHFNSAFGFVATFRYGNIFALSQNKTFDEWLSWMNKGLSKYSGGKVSLELADLDAGIQGPVVALTLVREGEKQNLVLHSTGPQPFEFLPSPSSRNSEDWPEW